jgi:hypothetical protein
MTITYRQPGFGDFEEFGPEGFEPEEYGDTEAFNLVDGEQFGGGTMVHGEGSRIDAETASMLMDMYADMAAQSDSEEEADAFLPLLAGLAPLAAKFAPMAMRAARTMLPTVSKGVMSGQSAASRRGQAGLGRDDHAFGGAAYLALSAGPGAASGGRPNLPQAGCPGPPLLVPAGRRGRRRPRLSVGGRPAMASALVAIEAAPARPAGALPTPVRNASARVAPTPRSAADPLATYLRGQAVANIRSALLLQPFREGEFGRGAAAPSTAHLAEVNQLLAGLRKMVDQNSRRLVAVSAAAARRPDRAAIDEALRLKQEGCSLVSATERIRQVYWEILGQRLTRIAPQLLAADRIALDCYQYVYGGLGKARSIPSPAPLSYMDSGFGPATFRRGVTMRKLLSLPNPFPLVKLPYSRLVTPWTLGAIPHEIGHNLQADLGLWLVVPRLIGRRLAAAGIDASVRRTWIRWTKETFADLIGVLLTGPAFVESTMDVVGKGAKATGAFNPRGVHPTPYLRVRISTHLLRAMGFENDARRIDLIWSHLYPPAVGEAIPPLFMRNFNRSMPIVVNAIANTAYPQLGGKTLMQVVSFRPQDQQVATEAAARLATGRDPGIVPERFLINAVRIAFDRRLASPATITRNFYEALGRR